MKRIVGLMIVLMLGISMIACGSSKTETETVKTETENKKESVEVETEKEQVETDTEEESAETEIKEETAGTEAEEDTIETEKEEPLEETETKPSGIEDDGIGEVVPLTLEEKIYVVSQDTNTWLEMSQEEKDELVVLMGRWMEEVTGYIVEDYEDMVLVLDHQMEQYYQFGVNEGVMRTVGEIYSVAMPLDDPSLNVGEKPSGVHEDGMGEDPFFGEGIGEVVALTPEEEEYMLSQTTNTWLELSETEKDDLIVLVGRWLENATGYIVEDYDDLVFMLDHQMEQYYRNGVDEKVLDTVCDILGIEL